MDGKEEFQQKYREYQLLSEQYARVQEQLQKTDEKVAQAGFVIDSITDFSKTAKGDEMLIPIADGVFARARLLDQEELLVNVGSDVVVKKDVQSAIRMLEEQKKRIEAFRDQMADLVVRMHDKCDDLRAELNATKV